MTATYTEPANNRANTLITDNTGPCFGTNSLATGVPFYYNSKWPTTAWEDYSSSGCYCYSVTGFSSGLALAANWSTNVSTNYEQVVLQFTKPVCAPINFTIWNVNQGNTSSPYPFTDNVDISALDNNSTSVPAANITIGNTCGNTVTTAGNTKTITGVQNNCSNCANDGSGSHTVSIGAVGAYISSITLKYYSSPTNTQANPASQYVIISDITTPCNTLLPVELLSFNGRCEGNKKTFEWTTATETNNAFFTVEKSKNGIDFSELGNISGAGNSSTIINYKTEFSEEDLDYKYYRLKQTDFDGKFSYSEVIYVSCTPDYYGDVFVYPNPASDIANLKFNSPIEGGIVFSFSDVLGRPFYSKEIPVVSIGEEISVSTSDLPAGVYFIRISSKEIKKSFPTLKLVIEK